MGKIINEYKKFALKGNVIDMAVGIVVGSAFTAITASLVANVIAPITGLMTGGVDLADLFLVLKQGAEGGPYITLLDANKDGAVTLSYGLVLNALISFLIVSWFAFLFVKGINRMRQKEEIQVEKTTKDCPYCCSSIAIKAVKCAYCASDIGDGAGEG